MNPINTNQYSNNLPSQAPPTPQRNVLNNTGNSYGNQGVIPRTNNLIIQNQGQQQQPIVPTRTNVSNVPNQNQHYQMAYNNNMQPQNQNLRQSPPPPLMNPYQNQGPMSPPPQQFHTGHNSPPPQQFQIGPNSPPQQQFHIGPNSPQQQQYHPNSPPPPVRQVSSGPSPGPRSPTHSSQQPFSPSSVSSSSSQQLPPPIRQASNRSQASLQQQQQQLPPPIRQASNRSQAPLLQQAPPPPVRQVSGRQQPQLPQQPPPLRQASNKSQNYQPVPTPARSISYNKDANTFANTESISQAGLSQRKQVPRPPTNDPSNPGIGRNRSFNSSTIGRSASNLKTRFANMMNRVPSIRRTFSTNQRNKNLRKKRLSVSGGIGVSTMYENSKKGKPIFENQLLKKPQNPNFIISLGIIIMISAVTLSIGIIAKYSGGLSEQDIHDITEMDIQGFIFFSLFLLIIALTGCIAYYKKWASLLLTFSVFIVFAFVIQMTIIFLFLNIYFNPVVQMRNKWINTLTDQEKVIYQDNNSCCGFLSVSEAILSSKCFPDEGQTTLTKFPGKQMVNNQNLYKRQDTTTTNGNNISTSSTKRDPNSYTEADLSPEGCGHVILKAIKTGLIQYIITECVMALLFIMALYFAGIHFKEQILMPKKLNLDAAKVTFG